jgi:uncharacterized protein involved in exopolysaccharide biosynthesis
MGKGGFVTQTEENSKIDGECQQDKDQEISLLDLLIVLAQRKRFILVFTLAVTLLGVVIAFVLPNQYTAETVILPPAQNQSSSAAMMSQMGGSALTSLAGSSLGIKNPGDMYVSLLRTRTVEDAVIQRFGLMARYKKIRMVDTRKALEKHVAVAFGTKDGLIRIDVRDRDSRMAANIANGYVDEFKKQSANLAITEAAQRRLFFQQQLEEAKNNLANAEIAMKDTEQSTGVLQIDSQAKALIESAAGLRAQVVAKQVQLQGLRSFATEDNPEVALAERQLGALQTQLGQLGGAGGGAADPMIPKGQIPEAGMEYIRKFRDVKYYETIYDLIAKQYEAAKLDEARQGATIQIVDAAVPPDKNSSPRRSILIIVIGACGILAASLMTIFQELIMRARDNTEINYKLNALLTTLHFYC